MAQPQQIRHGAHAALVPAADRHGRSLAKLHERIFASLGDDADAILDEAATALALLVEDQLLAETGIEIAVISDYALYDVRHDGRTAVERYRDQRRPACRSREGLLLAGMVTAYCSAFVVEAIEAEVGFAVRDALGGPRRFVVEPTFAAIAEAGNAFVARLVEIDGVTVHTTPFLPIDEVGLEDLRTELDLLYPDRDLSRRDDRTPEDAAEVHAVVWSMALASVDRTFDDVATELMEELRPTIEASSAGGTSRFWLPPDPTDQVLPAYAALTPADVAKRSNAPPQLVGPSGAPLPPSAPSPLPITRAESQRGDLVVDVPRYLELRQALVPLQHSLLESLSKEDFDDAGRSLGLLHGGTLVIGAEHEMTVLADHAIYDIRRHGHNAVERYRERHALDLNDVDRLLLEAMANHRYTVVIVEELVPGAGAVCTDLLGGPPLFLYDVGVSENSEPGLVLATRLIAPEGLTMSTGAALPVAQASTPDQQVSVIAAFADASLAYWRDPTVDDRIATIITFAMERASQATIVANDPTNPGAAAAGPNAVSSGPGHGKSRFSKLARPGRPKKRRH